LRRVDAVYLSVELGSHSLFLFIKVECLLQLLIIGVNIIQQVLVILVLLTYLVPAFLPYLLILGIHA
jgi:hypothetical protein